MTALVTAAWTTMAAKPDTESSRYTTASTRSA